MNGLILLCWGFAFLPVISGNTTGTGFEKTAGSMDSLQLIAPLVRMVTDSFNRTLYPEAGRSMASQRAYRILELRPGLGSRSHILQGFNAQAGLSNTGNFVRIEDALAENRLQQANQLLNHLNPHDNVERNKKAYLTAYLHHKQGVFSIQDSLELLRLARGCSKSDGYVVLHARALYRLKSKDFTNFFDDCDNTQILRPANTDKFENSGLIIYPNPSTGEVWINLKEVVNEAELSVFSVNGTIVHSEIINNIPQDHKIAYDFENGVYIITLKKGDKIQQSKVVIIK